MHKWNRLSFLLPSIGLVALGAACGGSSSSSSGSLGPGYYISISNLTYSPLNLEAPPGATVTVLNFDSPMAHSVTSEAVPATYEHNTTGISFDTGAISGTSGSFALPMTAPAGTVLNFYCTQHLATMLTPNGTITVNPNAQPSQPPPNPGGGYVGY